MAIAAGVERRVKADDLLNEDEFVAATVHIGHDQLALLGQRVGQRVEVDIRRLRDSCTALCENMFADIAVNAAAMDAFDSMRRR